jgi:hypothetical protein
MDKIKVNINGREQTIVLKDCKKNFLEQMEKMRKHAEQEKKLIFLKYRGRW